MVLCWAGPEALLDWQGLLTSLVSPVSPEQAVPED